MIVLFFQALHKFFLESASSLENFAQNKVKPKLKTYLLTLLVLVGLAFIPSIIPFYAGIYLDSRFLILFSGVWSAVFLLLFMGASAPLIALYHLQKNGLSQAIPRTLAAIEAVFVTKLILTLVACFIPFKNNLPMVPVYLLSSFLFGLIFTQVFRKEIVGVIVALFFVGITLTFFFPGAIDSTGHKIKDKDEREVSPIFRPTTCDNYRQRDYFYPRSGKPRFLYRIKDDGTFEIFSKQTDHEVVDTSTGEALRELDAKTLKVFQKQMQDQCAAAQISAAETPPPVADAAPDPSYAYSPPVPYSPPQYSPPPAPTPSNYIQAADFLNQAATQEVAVLIIDAQTKTRINANKALASYFRSQTMCVTDSFFNDNFIADGVFEDLFRGNENKIIAMDLTKHLDYIVLGKKSSRPVTSALLKSSGNPAAGLSLEIRVISARTGKIIDRFTVTSEGTGLSTDSAEKAAIGTSLNILQKKLTNILA